MPQTLVNGRARDWVQIKMTALGRTSVGVTEIEYKETQEKENIYGAGDEPVSRGYGKKGYEASITLPAEEVDALELIAPDGDITKIPPFPITVSFTEGSRVKTDILQFAEFMENGRSSKTGDKTIPVKLPLIIAGIKRI
jgi:hypothetical protein